MSNEERQVGIAYGFFNSDHDSGIVEETIEALRRDPQWGIDQGMRIDVYDEVDFFNMEEGAWLKPSTRDSAEAMKHMVRAEVEDPRGTPRKLEVPNLVRSLQESDLRKVVGTTRSKLDTFSQDEWNRGAALALGTAINALYDSGVITSSQKTDVLVAYRTSERGYVELANRS